MTFQVKSIKKWCATDGDRNVAIVPETTAVIIVFGNYPEEYSAVVRSSGPTSSQLN